MAARGFGFGGVLGGLAGGIAAAFAGGEPVSGAAAMVEEERRIAVDGVGRKPGRWPKRGCRGARLARSVPGHAGVFPVGDGFCGGALG